MTPAKQATDPGQILPSGEEHHLSTTQRQHSTAPQPTRWRGVTALSTANKVAWGDSSQQPTRWCGVTALNSQQGCVGCPHPEHCSTVALCPTAQRRHRISCAPPQLKNTPQDSNYTPSSNLCDQCPVGEYSSSTSSSKGSQ